LKHT